MRIDAHQHYWAIERGDYGWITPDIPALYRDFLPEHLAPELKKRGIDRTILVQAAPTLEETDYILALAERSDSIAGVVGWLDLFDPDHFKHYERFRAHPKFVGFRTMIQEMPDANAVLEPAYVNALRAYAELDVPVDLLLTSAQLEPVVRLLDEVPGLRGVVDHLAKPRIAEGLLDPWRSQMSAIARHPGIYCKLSGMVTEADHASWKREQFLPYVRHVLDIFGPTRVMFGSDWPVSLLAASYGEVVDALAGALPADWSKTNTDRLFGLNAKEFYKL